VPVDNHIFFTLWDGGGSDTLNLVSSNYDPGDPTIDLDPGDYTTTKAAQLAELATGVFAAGCVYMAYQSTGGGDSDIEDADVP
jgi:hypothetical protein